MEDAAGPAPAATPGDGVLVLSAWTEGAPGGLMVRATMSGAGHEARVRTLSEREQVHDVVDEWLDELLHGADVGRPGA
jgi:hypothetical protein